MESSVGFMTVFAVSGSVVLVALQVHKRLLSDFMKKVELEFGGIEKYQRKKKVRFASDVLEPSSDNKEYRKRRTRLLPYDHHRLSSGVGVGGLEQCQKSDPDEVLTSSMPENRRALYKGIVEFRTLKGANTVTSCV